MTLTISKLLALAGLVLDASLDGVLKAWTLPFIIVVFSANIVAVRFVMPWQLKKYYPQGLALKAESRAKLEPRGFANFLINIALYGLVPHYVVHAMGDDANSSIYIALMVGYSLYLIVDAFGMILVAKDATNPGKLEKYSYETLRKTLLVVVPVVLLVLAAAPLLFTLSGRTRTAAGVMLVRLFALSVIPYAFNAVYVSFLHAKRRSGSIIAIYLSTSVLILGLSIWLIEPFERTGLGIAWLASQMLVAGYLFGTQMWRLWLPYVNIKRWLPLLALPLDWWRSRQRTADTPPELSLLPQALAAATPTTGTIGDPTSWQAQRVLKMGLNDVVILLVGAENAPPSALLKVPRSEEPRLALQRHRDALRALLADSRLKDWNHYLPDILAEGEIDGQYYVLEQAVQGQDVPYRNLSDSERQRVQTIAMAAIAELHRSTAAEAEADEALLRQWVDEPIDVIRRVLGTNTSYEPKLQQIQRELYQALNGRRMTSSWTHGDYWFGNILMLPSERQISGIIDWDLAKPNDLPLFDWVHLLISSRTLVEKRELGDVIQDLLTGTPWTAHEQKLLDNAWNVVGGDALGTREMLLLSWLKHTAGNLTKSDRYEGHWLWMAKNVEIVLRCI